MLGGRVEDGSRRGPSLVAGNGLQGSHEELERRQRQLEHGWQLDPIDSKPGKPIFNRTATLRDTWSKEAAKEAAKE